VESKRREEEERRKQEETHRKAAEEAKKRKEQQSILTVLAVLIKFANAMPENFDQLKAKFDQTMQKDLPHTGSQQSTLKTEADRVLKHATSYVEQVQEQRRRWEMAANTAA